MRTKYDCSTYGNINDGINIIMVQTIERKNVAGRVPYCKSYLRSLQTPTPNNTYKHVQNEGECMMLSCEDAGLDWNEYHRY
jgi:hypothetical protein